MAETIDIGQARQRLPEFFVYLNDHLSDNGQDGTPLFQPLPRGTQLPDEKMASFRDGLAREIQQPGWRRLWLATDETGSILGHIDLMAHPEGCTAHRCLLGMGVHRDARRRGLGRRLIETVVGWAARETSLEWIDLWVLTGNEPAKRLYESCGFETLGDIPDLFRIDGRSEGWTRMALRVQPMPQGSIHES